MSWKQPGPKLHCTDTTISSRYVMGPGSQRIQETGYESVGRIHLDQSMGQRALVNTIMNLQAPQKLQASALSQQQLRSQKKLLFQGVTSLVTACMLGIHFSDHNQLQGRS
jgi:hypothetical protein